MFGLSWVSSARQAWYFGIAIGLAIYGPHLFFFWQLFGPGAVALWCVLAAWLSLFLLLGRAFRLQFGGAAWACAAPFLWIALEYFRSELYYLRFSWLNIGFAISDQSPLSRFSVFGVYGVGFIAMAIVSAIWLLWKTNGPRRFGAPALVAAMLLAGAFAPREQKTSGHAIEIAGTQLEFPSAAEVRLALDKLNAKYPNAQALILSEYTFQGPVPDLIKSWCRKNKKYLVVGGEVPTTNSQYYNTAFVVDPNGGIAFQQGKCVPVQLMRDGLPAQGQKVWESPWGKIGLGTCYDASYSRVTDELVRQGAQALLFPTMDVADWGDAEHRLHARIGPWRAEEYGVPVVRLCSSGISEAVDWQGKILASAPSPGPGAMLDAQLTLPERGRIPPDRYLAIFSITGVAVFCFWSLGKSLRARLAAGTRKTNN